MSNNTEKNIDLFNQVCISTGLAKCMKKNVIMPVDRFGNTWLGLDNSLSFINKNNDNIYKGMGCHVIPLWTEEDLFEAEKDFFQFGYLSDFCEEFNFVFLVEKNHYFKWLTNFDEIEQTLITSLFVYDKEVENMETENILKKRDVIAIDKKKIKISKNEIIEAEDIFVNDPSNKPLFEYNDNDPIQSNKNIKKKYEKRKINYKALIKKQNFINTFYNKSYNASCRKIVKVPEDEQYINYYKK